MAWCGWTALGPAPAIMRIHLRCSLQTGPPRLTAVIWTKPIVLALLVLSLGWLRGPAGEPGTTAPADRPASQPKLTERDYLVEELKLVEHQVAQEEKLAESGRSSADKLLSAKRSLLSLRRQLAAFDERTKRPDPADIERRKREAEEQKKAAEEQARQVAASKAEMASVLLDIARKDTDATVRYAAVDAVAALGLGSSIEPLSQIVLTDPDNEVRVRALQAIAAFRSPASTDALLGLYDTVPDTQLKQQAVAGLKEVEDRPPRSNYPGQVVEVVPVKAVPKLAQIAKDGPTPELRRTAIQQLHRIPGEATTTNLVGVYESCVDSQTKQYLVQCLGERRDAVAARKLVAIAQSDVDPRSRQVAVHLLGAMFSSPSSPSLPRPFIPSPAR